jgi:hypothetical protein
MTTRIITAAALGLACLAGCADEAPPPTEEPEPGAFWTPDELATGPRLWLEAEPDGDAVTLSLWGSELGGVFGWSAHVGGFEATLATVTAEVEPRLGPPADARVVATPHPGDVALGSARVDPSLGDVALDADVRLATVQLSPTAPVSTRIELRRAVVRRADGSYVAVTAAGGTLDTEGAR